MFRGCHPSAYRDDGVEGKFPAPPPSLAAHVDASLGVLRTNGMLSIPGHPGEEKFIEKTGLSTIRLWHLPGRQIDAFEEYVDWVDDSNGTILPYCVRCAERVHEWRKKSGARFVTEVWENIDALFRHACDSADDPSDLDNKAFHEGMREAIRPSM